MISIKPVFRLLLFIGLILAACDSANFFPTQPVYVPPTLVATSPSIPTTLPTSLPVTPTPSCLNNLTFLKDLTIPDGTNVNPGETLDKRWEVENTGTCNWEAGYTMHLIAGSEMGAHPEHPLLPARAGSTVTIRIIYTAPTVPGIYRSAWQAYDPGGNAFGDSIFVEIFVP
jgi:hypothetical protein